MRKLLCGALLLVGLAFAPVAEAATIQIGQTAAPNTGNGGGCSYCEDLQVSTDPSTPSYAVPAGDGGVITSWSVLGAPSGTSGPFDAWLLVFSPASPQGDFSFVAESAEENPPADGEAHSYPTSIVVQPGDVIGLEYTDVPAYFSDSGPAGNVVGNWGYALTAGVPHAPSTSTGLMSVAATLNTPTAAFTPSATSVSEGTSVSFDASASTSPATITDYDWNFGDGTTFDSATTASASHTFTAPGAHTVSLTITDSNSDTATVSETVTVLAPTPVTPTPSTPNPAGTSGPAFLGSSLASTTLHATSKGRVTLELVCSATASTSCEGNVGLYGATGATPRAASVHRRRKAVRLGSASFTVPSGQTAVEHIALDASGLALLKRKHFSARALMTATDGEGRTVTTLVGVTVKLVVRRARRAPLRGASSPASAGLFARPLYDWPAVPVSPIER
ncbi:MAG: PKD domain-containing protein [Solirubrobacteraceae bacterium]